MNERLKTRPVLHALYVVSFLCISAALYAADPAVALRERYLGPFGLPSEIAYAQSAGTIPAPGSESFEWQVVFKLAFRSGDLAKLDEAQVLDSDCYLVHRRTYTAPVRAEPVWDGRVYHQNGRLVVAAYTSQGERAFGYIDEQSRVVRSKDTDSDVALPDLSGVEYNPFTGQLWRRALGGKIDEEQRFHLPLALVNLHGEVVRPEFQIVREKGDTFSLVASSRGRQVMLARCALENGNAKRTLGYAPVLGPGCSMIENGPTIIIEIPGQINRDVLETRGPQLVLRSELPAPKGARPSVRIDGQFDEWRNVTGITDPKGDSVSYLQYNPDTDLLEFKVTNDDEYLYFYSRVAGRVGNTAGQRDRYYFYVYIDADRDATTGYVPTRDDNCYHGVTLGDDCEAQFEFVDGRFVKTFFGFAGLSTEKDVLKGQVALGPSWYNREDDQGRIRDGYKVEYIRRAAEIQITEDFREGTSDDIVIALSPDGSQCEMRVAMTGFLKTRGGKSVVAPGQRIDLAAGVEASGQIHGHSKWSADSTAVVRGYYIAK